MENPDTLYIINGDESIAISSEIISRYPNSPLYIFWKEFAGEEMKFEDLCQNLDYGLTFATFAKICDVIDGKRHLIDASLKVRNIMKKFNLILPLTEDYYENILDMTRQYCDEIHNLIFHKNTSMFLKYDQYCHYQKYLKEYHDIIPVQIIYDANIQSIHIYNGIPIYYQTKSGQEYFLKDEITGNEIALQVDYLRNQMIFRTAELVTPGRFDQTFLSYNTDIASYLRIYDDFHTACQNLSVQGIYTNFQMQCGDYNPEIHNSPENRQFIPPGFNLKNMLNELYRIIISIKIPTDELFTGDAHIYGYVHI